MTTEFEIKEFLEKIEQSFAKPEIVELKQISNSALQKAILENNKLLAKIALISYCLYKLLTKEHIVQNKNWNSVKKAISSHIEKALLAAKQQKTEETEKQLDLTIKDVNAIDRDLGFFLTSLFDKARVKLASSAYAHGLSLGRAAELTGTDKKNLLGYIANTVIHEEEKPVMGIAERIKKIKKLFL
jgi:hypothetical protein